MKRLILFSFVLIQALYADNGSETFSSKYEIFPRLRFFNRTNHNIEIVYTYKSDDGSLKTSRDTLSTDTLFYNLGTFDPSTITSMEVIIRDRYQKDKIIARRLFEDVNLFWKKAYSIFDKISFSERVNSTLDLDVVFYEKAHRIRLNGALSLELLHLVSEPTKNP